MPATRNTQVDDFVQRYPEQAHAFHNFARQCNQHGMMVRMDPHDRAELKSPILKRALQTYASSLLGTFGRNLGALSMTGIPLERRHRATLQIDAFCQERERLAGWSGRRELGLSGEAEDPGHSVHPVSDRSFFDQWLTGPREPLLIVATFGLGKSVLLAELACRLAELLKDHQLDLVKGAIAFVPFPIRLRDWLGETDASFEDFVIKAACRLQPTILGGLTDVQLRLLFRTKIALPLFDGLDELPEHITPDGPSASRPIRNEALEGMIRLGCSYILTSRPGHGAEGRFRNRSHTLRELNHTEVVNYINARFSKKGDTAKVRELSTGARLDPTNPIVPPPVLQAYRDTPTHVLDVLHRPLFLAAWCDRVAQDPAAPPPTSVESLMVGIVLGLVLDPAKAKLGGSRQELFDQLLARQHGLGALLTMFADRGFGVRLPRHIVSQCLFEHSSSHEAAQLSMNMAEKAGFLIPANDGYYAIKVPATEYLVGTYLATLSADAPNAANENPLVKRNRFLRIFQRWSWWPDYEPIWLFAFDHLWRGTIAQQSLAEGLVRWLVDLSRQYLKASGALTTKTADTTVGSIHLTHCRLILEVLPTESGTAGRRRSVGVLTAKALSALVRQSIAVWHHENDLAGHWLLMRPSLRYRQRLCRRLLRLLKDHRYASVWRSMAGAIYRLGLIDTSELAEFAADTLSHCLRCCADARVRRQIADDLSGAIGFADLPARDSKKIAMALILLLAAPDYAHAVEDIISSAIKTIECSPAGIDGVIDVLTPLLHQTEYRAAWQEIVLALTRWATELTVPAASRLTDGLLKCLASKDHSHVRLAIFAAAEELIEKCDGPTALRLGLGLAARLEDCQNQEVQWSFESSVETLAGRLDAEGRSSVVTAVLRHLDSDTHPQLWDLVLNSIRQLGQDLRPEVAESTSVAIRLCFSQPEYADVEDSLCGAFRAVASACDITKRKDLLESLLAQIPRLPSSTLQGATARAACVIGATDTLLADIVTERLSALIVTADGENQCASLVGILAGAAGTLGEKAASKTFRLIITRLQQARETETRWDLVAALVQTAQHLNEADAEEASENLLTLMESGDFTSFTRQLADAASAAVTKLSAPIAARMFTRITALYSADQSGFAAEFLTAAAGAAASRLGPSDRDGAMALLMSPLQQSDSSSRRAVASGLRTMAPALESSVAWDAYAAFLTLLEQDSGLKRDGTGEALAALAERIDASRSSEAYFRLAALLARHPAGHVGPFGEALVVSARRMGSTATPAVEALFPILVMSAHSSMRRAASAALTLVVADLNCISRVDTCGMLLQRLSDPAFREASRALRAGILDLVSRMTSAEICLALSRMRGSPSNRGPTGPPKDVLRAVLPTLDNLSDTAAGSVVRTLTEDIEPATWSPYLAILPVLAARLDSDDAASLIENLKDGPTADDPDRVRLVREICRAAYGRMRRDAAVRAANRWLAEGQAQDVRELVKRHPGLVLCVQELDAGVRSGQISFTVYDRFRDDDVMLLDAARAFAPPSIQGIDHLRCDDPQRGSPPDNAVRQGDSAQPSSAGQEQSSPILGSPDKQEMSSNPSDNLVNLSEDVDLERLLDCLGDREGELLKALRYHGPCGWNYWAKKAKLSRSSIATPLARSSLINAGLVEIIDTGRKYPTYQLSGRGSRVASLQFQRERHT